MNHITQCTQPQSFAITTRSGVVVSKLALINDVNLRRTRLVLRWVTVLGSIPSAGHLFQYVTNQPPKANSAFHPSGVSKWVPASAGKAKAGMIHSVSGWTRGVVCRQNCEIPWERMPYLSALDVRSRRGTIQIHVYLYLYLQWRTRQPECLHRKTACLNMRFLTIYGHVVIQTFEFFTS